MLIFLSKTSTPTPSPSTPTPTPTPTFQKTERAPMMIELRRTKDGRLIPSPIRSPRYGPPWGPAPKPDPTIAARTKDPRQTPRKLIFDHITPRTLRAIDMQYTGLPRYSFECTSFNAYSAFVGIDSAYLRKFQELFERCTIHFKRLSGEEMAMPENENVKLVIWAIPKQLHPDRSTLAEINGLLRGLAIWSKCYYWNSGRKGTIRIDEFAEDYPYLFAPRELSDAAPSATPVWTNTTAASAGASSAGPTTSRPVGNTPSPQREDDDLIDLESDDDESPSTTSAVGAFPRPTAPKHTTLGPSSAAPPQRRLESGTMRDTREAQVGTTPEMDEIEVAVQVIARKYLKSLESGEKNPVDAEMWTMFNILRNRDQAGLIKHAVALMSDEELQAAFSSRLKGSKNVNQVLVKVLESVEKRDSVLNYLSEEELQAELSSMLKGSKNAKQLLVKLFESVDKEKRDSVLNYLNP